MMCVDGTVAERMGFGVACKCVQVQIGTGTGVVGSLFEEKGFGFIVQHNSELDDLFFHFTEYPRGMPIQMGDEVQFECVRNGGKFKAQNIHILKKSNNGSKMIYSTRPRGGRGGAMNSHHSQHHNHRIAGHSAHPQQQMTIPPPTMGRGGRGRGFFHGNRGRRGGIANNGRPIAGMANMEKATNGGTTINGSHGIDVDRPKLGCFKLVKKDVTDRPMYIPVFPIKNVWRERKQFV